LGEKIRVEIDGGQEVCSQRPLSRGVWGHAPQKIFNFELFKSDSEAFQDSFEVSVAAVLQTDSYLVYHTLHTTCMHTKLEGMM